MRGGKWVFGQSNEEVQEGSRWVVNIRMPWRMAILLGRAARKRGEVLAMAMTAPKPARPAAIDGVPFKELRTFDLKCLDGDDRA